MKGIGASSRIFELLDSPSSRSAGSLSSRGFAILCIESNDVGGIVPMEPAKGCIVFENVGFRYPTRVDPVLSDLSLTISPGRVLAIVGKSGSGKSTIASLLLRFYEADSGRITLDDHNISALDAAWLRNQIGHVAQEPALFAGTIGENIAYGCVDASPEQVRWAAREAKAADFIDLLPDQYDTFVGERGVALSGGQRQRIAIARALLKNPRILILDEATSALDSENEGLVQQALERLMKDRTVITIAHRPSTIQRADSIVVLHHGRVAETGTYESLISKPSSLFRQLMQSNSVQ